PPAVCLPSSPPDVMGYHDAREIPNYWAYARNFVLNDHMFEPVASWSLPSHLYLVSGWSARCRNASPASCRNDPTQPSALKLPGAFVSCTGPRGLPVIRLRRPMELTMRQRRIVMTCLSKLTAGGRERALAAITGGGGGEGQRLSRYSWTDLTYLLHEQH